MIAGTGVDIVSIERMRSAVARHPGRFASRILSVKELETFSTLTDGAAYLSKRFAAKEAFFKALGQPSSSANTWRQLSIVNDASGRPRLEFSATLARLLAGLGIVATFVSLSDEREYAIATIILEKN